jgi:hypothetical protein
MSSNQGLWADFGVVEELTEQAAETISGGTEIFSIYNNTNVDVLGTIDGNIFGIKSGDAYTYTTGGSGLITFDYDVRAGVIANKSYNLSDGGNYYFDPNDNTVDPYDIDLYKIA